MSTQQALARSLYRAAPAVWRGLDQDAVRDRLLALLGGAIQARDLDALVSGIQQAQRDDAPPSDAIRQAANARMGGPGLPF
jgi:hypothetical protein